MAGRRRSVQAPCARQTGLARARAAAPLLVAASVLAACSATYDWRELRADEVLALWLPCKPEQRERRVTLAGGEVAMRMLSCEAGGQVYAVARVDAPGPARQEPLLQALRGALQANLGAASPTPGPAWAAAPVAGETPHPLAQALALEGRHAEGTVRAQVRWFCRGERIYQATVIGRTLDARAAETFFGSLKLSG